MIVLLKKWLVKIMATSSELYAEQARLIQAKAEFNSNVNNFLSACKETASKANLIKQSCMQCGDTNIQSIVSSGGCVQRMIENVNKLQENVSSALTTALANIQAEVDELGRQAAAAAARELAARRAATKAAERRNMSGLDIQ